MENSNDYGFEEEIDIDNERGGADDTAAEDGAVEDSVADTVESAGEETAAGGNDTADDGADFGSYGDAMDFSFLDTSTSSAEEEKKGETVTQAPVEEVNEPIDLSKIDFGRITSPSSMMEYASKKDEAGPKESVSAEDSVAEKKAEMERLADNMMNASKELMNNPGDGDAQKNYVKATSDYDKARQEYNAAMKQSGNKNDIDITVTRRLESAAGFVPEGYSKHQYDFAKSQVSPDSQFVRDMSKYERQVKDNTEIVERLQQRLDEKKREAEISSQKKTGGLSEKERQNLEWKKGMYEKSIEENKRLLDSGSVHPLLRGEYEDAIAVHTEELAKINEKLKSDKGEGGSVSITENPEIWELEQSLSASKRGLERAQQRYDESKKDYEAFQKYIDAYDNAASSQLQSIASQRELEEKNRATYEKEMSSEKEKGWNTLEQRQDLLDKYRSGEIGAAEFANTIENWDRTYGSPTGFGPPDEAGRVASSMTHVSGATAYDKDDRQELMKDFYAFYDEFTDSMNSFDQKWGGMLGKVGLAAEGQKVGSSKGSLADAVNGLVAGASAGQGNEQDTQEARINAFSNAVNELITTEANLINKGNGSFNDIVESLVSAGADIKDLKDNQYVQGMSQRIFDGAQRVYETAVALEEKAKQLGIDAYSKQGAAKETMVKAEAAVKSVMSGQPITSDGAYAVMDFMSSLQGVKTAAESMMKSAAFNGAKDTKGGAAVEALKEQKAETVTWKDWLSAALWGGLSFLAMGVGIATANPLLVVAGAAANVRTGSNFALKNYMSHHTKREQMFGSGDENPGTNAMIGVYNRALEKANIGDAKSVGTYTTSIGGAVDIAVGLVGLATTGGLVGIGNIKDGVNDIRKAGGGLRGNAQRLVDNIYTLGREVNAFNGTNLDLSGLLSVSDKAQTGSLFGTERTGDDKEHIYGYESGEGEADEKYSGYREQTKKRNIADDYNEGMGQDLNEAVSDMNAKVFRVYSREPEYIKKAIARVLKSYKEQW